MRLTEAIGYLADAATTRDPSIPSSPGRPIHGESAGVHGASASPVERRFRHTGVLCDPVSFA